MMTLSAVSLAAAVASANFGIVPGLRIGHARLGHEVPAALGSPTFSDGAAGHVWSTWKGTTGNTLDVYGVIGDIAGHLTKYVRVTSPVFKTANGVRTGQTWHQIKAHYPAVLLTTYDSHQFSRKLAIVDNKSNGIAFEITVNAANHVTNASVCKAVWIHKCGELFDPSTWVVYEPTRP